MAKAVWNEETLAESTIIEVVPQGARFLETDHTLRHFRAVSWFPEIMDRRVPLAWQESPAGMLERARAKAIDLEERAPNLCPLHGVQKREIERILAAADRELG